MTALAADTRQSTSDAASATRYRIEFLREWAQVAARWDAIGHATPFQDGRWLAAWYAAFATESTVTPLIALISDVTTSKPVLALPLIRRTDKGVRIVEFADLDLTDYNAPVWTAAAPRDPATMRHLWRELRSALRELPGGVDLIRLRKMPVEIAGRVNPLSLLPTSACVLNGNVVTTGDDYDVWRFTLERTVRKELERSWRVFTRDPTTSFRVVTDQVQAQALLATMEVQQESRMAGLGLQFVLNGDRASRFYRNLVAETGNGFVVLTALMAGDDVVATLLGICDGDRYVMIRISNAGEKWSNCSPGRLIIERTMAMLHADGIRQFDFSIGNYAYKRRFGVTSIPLVDLTAALTWRGWPHAARAFAAQWLRRYPMIDQKLRRVLGKPTAPKE